MPILSKSMTQHTNQQTRIPSDDCRKQIAAHGCMDYRPSPEMIISQLRRELAQLREKERSMAQALDGFRQQLEMRDERCALLAIRLDEADQDLSQAHREAGEAIEHERRKVRQATDLMEMALAVMSHSDNWTGAVWRHSYSPADMLRQIFGPIGQKSREQAAEFRESFELMHANRAAFAAFPSSVSRTHAENFQSNDLSSLRSDDAGVYTAPADSMVAGAVRETGVRMENEGGNTP